MWAKCKQIIKCEHTDALYNRSRDWLGIQRTTATNIEQSFQQIVRAYANAMHIAGHPNQRAF